MEGEAVAVIAVGGKTVVEFVYVEGRVIVEGQASVRGLIAGMGAVTGEVIVAGVVVAGVVTWELSRVEKIHDHILCFFDDI